MTKIINKRLGKSLWFDLHNPFREDVSVQMDLHEVHAGG